MRGELAAVVGGDCFQMFTVAVQESDHGFGKGSGLLAVLEAFEEHEARETFEQHEDGVSAGIHDEVHLEIAEAGAVGFLGAVVDAGAVGYVGGFRRSRRAFVPAHEVGVAAVLHQLAGGVGVDDVVDGLYGDGYALLGQHAPDLLRRPVVDDHLPDAPHKETVQLLVGRGAPAPCHGLGVGLVPQVVAFLRGVAFEFACDCRPAAPDDAGDLFSLGLSLQKGENLRPLLRG